MMEFLNNYSPLFITVIIGLLGYMDRRRSKKEKEKTAKLAKDNETASIASEELAALQKKEQLKKDADLKKTLDDLNYNVGRLDQSINSINGEVKKMSDEFSDFKRETKQKFAIISDNGAVTMKYTRGIATVTLELIHSLGYTEKENISVSRFQDMCDDQDDKLLEALYGDIKK